MVYRLGNIEEVYMVCNENNYIHRLKKGKEDSLEYIVDKYLPLVKGITCKVLSPLRNEHIIEECVNDVFLSVWVNRSKFKGENNEFKKWIGTISKYKAIDYYRKEIKKLEISLDVIKMEGSNLVEDEIIATENREELMKAIDLLDPMDKEIFIMKFFLGIKSQDIATKFNTTKASIDNRICRSRKKIKANLKTIKLEVI